jgi:crotonobetainyl-CoA:carnitine CoA-transferase CaiB-like acyl-CoA transferase
MHAIGRGGLADDPAFAHNDGRVAQAALLDAAIGGWTSQHTIEHVLATLEQAGVPAGRIYSAADIVGDPHYQARDMILRAQLPGGVEVKMPGIVPKLSDTPGQVNWPGPALGAHTSEVLAGLGLASSEIQHLQEAGVVQ